jgi:tetratricopeptide (TPR) repeat protein
MTELEPLLKRIEQLTPHFGRAREDLEALTTRGRHQDYKGVLQNARLVVEMLLRSLITTELKQTPGKAMLDELLAKFRQQAHAGVIPTNILAHMGTVQAWGNLSSHDHSGGLHEAGVKVGLEEAMASLNSLVAILTWYKDRYATPAAGTSAVAPGPRERAPAGKRLALIGGGVLVGLVAVLAVLASRTVPPAAEELVQPRSRLDALYAELGEPVPPAECQEQDPQALAALLAVAPRLSERVPEATRAQEATTALENLRARGKGWRPEGWLHIARASLLAGTPDAAAMSSALGCSGFAAAENLAGRMAALAQDWTESAAHYTRAAELDARFWKPRFNLGLIHLQQKRVEDAVPLLEQAAGLAPEVAEIPLFLGHAYAARAAVAQGSGREQEATADRERAKEAWCRARERGSPQAAALCKP